jgi:hypothetical protein
VAAAAFAVLAPLWYRSPVHFAAFRAPLGTRVTRALKFSVLDIGCTFVGYGLFLVAIALRLLGK